MIQLILNIILISSTLSHDIKPLSNEFIDLINSKQNTWIAQRYNNKTIEDYDRLLGARKMDLRSKYKPTIHSDNIQIPESFDARTNWPNCNSVIGSIADQSECGACWAVASTSVMSDRRCIASNGTFKQPVSAIDVISCCGTCGSGCRGGFPNEAFKYWKSDGIVTGGKYDSNEGCKPYPFQPCEQSGNGKYVPCDSLDYSTPRCETKCTNNKLDYESSKSYGDSDVEWFDNVQDIQKEILTNGPVLATMTIYADFMTYKSGVYKYILGNKRGNHAVRIIGWGTDHATSLPYWLVANSWNEDWGEKGLFRIVRGENNCEIEEMVIASTPKL